MATSYSAIKIPVPGNLIDTPNAENGHLLHFQDGVFTNFKPLIVDLRPDTAHRQLSFAVSVDGGNKTWGELTETGMVFSKDTPGTDNDFRLTVNSNVIGNATVDIKGDLAIGSSANRAYKFPDGIIRPTDWLKQSIPVVDPNGIIIFKTISGFASSSDASVKITDNNIIINRDILAGLLYNATGGIEITGNTAISGSDVKLDLSWCRTQNTSALDQTGIFHCTGGVVNTNGVLSLDMNKANDIGTFTTDDFFQMKNLGPARTSLSFNRTHAGKPGEQGGIFNEGDGIALDLGGTGRYAISSSWRTRETLYNSSWTNLDGSPGATGDAAMLAMEGTLSPDHLRLEGGWVFPLTGGFDDGVQLNERHFVQVIKNVQDSYGLQNDGGGLKIQCTDYNDDEYAIHCENLSDHNSGAWITEGGFDTSRIDLGPNNSTFYVRAKTGCVYSAGGVFTEGRLHIGHYQAMLDSGYSGVAGLRYTDNMPAVPAHITITSDAPSIMLNQTSNDSTAPIIRMTSADPGNIAKWGTANATKNAFTNISNRDGSIIAIETSVTGSNKSFLENTIAEDRLHSSTDIDIAHCWGLQAYTDVNSGELKVYQRMGASAHGSTTAGTHYLPIGTNTAPTGVGVGGLWMDAGDTTTDGKNYTVRIRIS